RGGVLGGEKHRADPAELKNIAEQEARAEQHDSGFEPEFVSGQAGLECGGDAGSVGNDQSDEDGPEYIFNVGKSEMVRLAVGGERALEKFSSVSDRGQEKQARENLSDAFEDAERWRLRERDRTGHAINPPGANFAATALPRDVFDPANPNQQGEDQGERYSPGVH